MAKTYLKSAALHFNRDLKEWRLRFEFRGELKKMDIPDTLRKNLRLSKQPKADVRQLTNGKLEQKPNGQIVMRFKQLTIPLPREVLQYGTFFGMITRVDNFNKSSYLKYYSRQEKNDYPPDISQRMGLEK